MHWCECHQTSCTGVSVTRPHALVSVSPDLMHWCQCHQTSCTGVSVTRQGFIQRVGGPGIPPPPPPPPADDFLPRADACASKGLCDRSCPFIYIYNYISVCHHECMWASQVKTHHFFYYLKEIQLRPQLHIAAAAAAAAVVGSVVEYSLITHTQTQLHLCTLCPREHR